MPLFKFELTEKAALKNYLVLGKFNFDLEKAIQAQKNSPIGYGSEFRKPEVLEPLFAKHPFWESMKRNLTIGAKYTL